MRKYSTPQYQLTPIYIYAFPIMRITGKQVSPEKTAHRTPYGTNSKKGTPIS